MPYQAIEQLAMEIVNKGLPVEKCLF